MSLMTLNCFKTSSKILTNIPFYLVSCSDVRCQGIELEISYHVNIEIFISVFVKWFVHNKKKIQMFLLNMSFISLMK